MFLEADLETDVDAISVCPFNAKQRRRDWQEILKLSRELGDQHLEARAQGEIGLVRILEGDPEGSDEVGAALWKAKNAGDARNELRFRTAIANLYLMVGRHHDALGHLERSVELADSEHAFSFFPAKFDRAAALLADHRLPEAAPRARAALSMAGEMSRPTANVPSADTQGIVAVAATEIQNPQTR